MKPYRCKISGMKITLKHENDSYYWQTNDYRSAPHETLSTAMQDAIGYITILKRKKYDL